MDLKNFPKRYDWFVGIDSDGCVFPTMDIKQKECFHPAIMDQWGLWKVEKEVRMVAEWVNLYSVYRGVNRFPGLRMTFDFLREMDSVRTAGIAIRATEDLEAYIKSGLPLGNDTLKTYVQTHPSLADVLEWSLEVNRRVATTVKEVPPFPFVRESLEKLRPRVDMIVVSQTPTEALVREWKEHAIDGLVDFIAGQEQGSKKEHLQMAAAPNYPTDRILMIGDALGDLKAVEAVGGFFFPINPGHESESWENFYREGIEKFLSGGFKGAYQEKLMAAFKALLPERPHWK